MGKSKKSEPKPAKETKDADDDVIILSDGSGKDTEFRCLTMLEVDGIDYAVLTTNKDLDDVEAEFDLFLFEHEVDEDGDEIFAEIEDEDTWNKVQSAATSLLLAGDDDNADNADSH